MRELKNSIEEYHSDPTHLSKTAISMLMDSPRNYWAHYLAPTEDKEAFKSTKSTTIGEGVHVRTLEPDLFDSSFFVAKNDRRTKAYKEEILENRSKISLSSGEYDQICRMSDALLATPETKKYFDLAGKPEVSFYWNDPESGVALKCRPDKITDNSEFCLDIKTTRDVTKKAFQNDAFKFKYWLSAALTLEGVTCVRNRRPDQYLFLCVESSGSKKPSCAVYSCSSDAIELGEYVLKEALSLYKGYAAKGVWPVNTSEDNELNLTSYGYHQLQAYREQSVEKEFDFAI